MVDEEEDEESPGLIAGSKIEPNHHIIANQPTSCRIHNFGSFFNDRICAHFFLPLGKVEGRIGGEERDG